jgi:DNA-binding FadR family transcriptional regulator
MDHGAFMDSDTRFRLAIAHAAPNLIFEAVGSTIQSIVRIWYPKTYYIPETKGRTIAEHRAIADGVASGDMDGGRSHARAPRRRGPTLVHPSARPGNSRLSQSKAERLQES